MNTSENENTPHEAQSTPDLEEKYKLAKAAVQHVLNAIADDPRKYWLMGNGTGSWEKLTLAAAAIWDEPVEKIRKDFQPNERAYRIYCEEKEKDERLLEFCRENNITGKPEDVGPYGPIPLVLVSEEFVDAMDRELLANQKKGDWKAWQPDRLDCVDELYHHLKKLHRSLSQNDTERVAEYSADLANIAMKTHERHGRQ